MKLNWSKEKIDMEDDFTRYRYKASTPNGATATICNFNDGKDLPVEWYVYKSKSRDSVDEKDSETLVGEGWVETVEAAKQSVVELLSAGVTE